MADGRPGKREGLTAESLQLWHIARIDCRGLIPTGTRRRSFVMAHRHGPHTLGVPAPRTPKLLEAVHILGAGIGCAAGQHEAKCNRYHQALDGFHVLPSSIGTSRPLPCCDVHSEESKKPTQRLLLVPADRSTAYAGFGWSGWRGRILLQQFLTGNVNLVTGGREEKSGWLMAGDAKQQRTFSVISRRLSVPETEN